MEIKRGWELGHNKTTRFMKFALSVCPLCNKERWLELRHGKPNDGLCKSCGKKGDKAYQWRGGRHYDQGYVLVWLSPKDFFFSMAGKKWTVPEHRLIMARHLGRCLHPWEIVHHKNGIRDDNRIENLELSVSLGEHIANHSKGYKDGYHKGLIDGHNKQIQLLKAEIERIKGK